MYKSGDKFIIEIESVIGNGIYKLKGFDYITFSDSALNRLESFSKYNEELTKINIFERENTKRILKEKIDELL